MSNQVKPAEPMADTDKFPFGQYKGVPMQDVPADYYNYLWRSGMSGRVQFDRVAAYIKRCIPAFQMENADLIWT